MGPTLFFERETLIKLGGFDEQFPFVEDYPIIMKFLSNGYRIHLINDFLIKYREYPESVSNSNPKFATSIYDAIEAYAIPLSFKHRMYFYWYHYKIFFETKRLLNNNKSFAIRLFVYLLRATDVIGIKKKLMKIRLKGTF